MKKSKITIAASWALVVLAACGIFYMSSKQSTSMSGGIIGEIRELLVALLTPIFGAEVDVSPIGHFGEYALFTAALINALRFHLDIKGVCFSAITIASLYGITDEFHQSFVPTRSCDPMDWLVDTFAALCVAAIFFCIKKKNPMTKSQDQ